MADENNDTTISDTDKSLTKDKIELETQKDTKSVTTDENTQQNDSPKTESTMYTDDNSSDTSLMVKTDASSNSGDTNVVASVDNNSKPKLPDITGTPIVVDASDHVAGRLSSLVAKLLLQGNRISLVNCERIMISGTRSNTIYEYRQFLKINSIINPKHGPVHYRRPDTVITKMIRGMLPFEKKPSGKTAHKRLRAYVGSPKELKSFKKIQFEKAKIRRAASSYTTMGELCRVIGWTE